MQRLLEPLARPLNFTDVVEYLYAEFKEATNRVK